MALTEFDVKKIAEYARIALPDEKLPHMTTYLNEVILTLEPITTFDLEHVSSTYHPTADLVNVMREDVAQETMPIEEILHNAGSTEGRYFKVPTILGGGDLG